MGTDEYGLGAGEVPLNVPHDFQTVRAGHVHVGDQQIRQQRGDQFQGFCAVADLSDQAEVSTVIEH